MEIWRKSSSTGVSRPKMETRTVTFPLASSMADTVPRRSVKGPSMMRTASPMVKAAWNLGADCSPKAAMALTSFSGRGVG
ncbi:MAG: hypothetical protein UW23_C0001G0018 [Candidatus Collierbacteria bacterium GW2011_GWA1_44_12]|uniref:Uncharacterized protein n=1 Tax=Candidatus Collierbacteria bacterium GW2011_GWA1_44_12 TaxID=1618376 RepID=A0A0G1GPZ0_9BACT|nr:MAG: hypothetical protein UW23_C0001G0018 [Candidatus Collierbacteria bacterium GW2011_GWA1_44_12]